jgi:hypothetical protein
MVAVDVEGETSIGGDNGAATGGTPAAFACDSERTSTVNIRVSRRLLRWFAIGAASIGLAGIYATPAQADTTYYIAAFTFTKNWSQPDHSSLNLTIRAVVSGVLKPPSVNVTVRAGSGDGTTDGCVVDHGWLPNGTYHVQEVFYDRASIITGHAFWLNDTYCSNGTKRSALFIHSSYPWSDTNPDDYVSEGCIKVNNTSIDTLYNDYTAYDFPIDTFYKTSTPNYGQAATGGVPNVVVSVQ